MATARRAARRGGRSVVGGADSLVAASRGAARRRRPALSPDGRERDHLRRPDRTAALDRGRDAEPARTSGPGAIWYKEGTGSALPHTHVHVTAIRSLFAAQRRVTVRYSGGGASELVRTYRFQSVYHHPVEFEFDSSRARRRPPRSTPAAHPNRPATLPSETLTIENVYRRAGFDVSVSSNGGSVPLARLRRRQRLERHRDARRDAGLLVALRRTCRSGRCGCSSPPTHEDGHEPRRHHVRRHRSEPPPGHGDLQRLLHLGAARGRRRRRPPGWRGCASGPPATRWATPSISRIPGRSRIRRNGARRGCRSATSPRRAAS